VPCRSADTTPPGGTANARVPSSAAKLEPLEPSTRVIATARPRRRSKSWLGQERRDRASQLLNRSWSPLLTEPKDRVPASESKRHQRSTASPASTRFQLAATRCDRADPTTRKSAPRIRTCTLPAFGSSRIRFAARRTGAPLSTLLARAHAQPCKTRLRLATCSWTLGTLTRGLLSGISGRYLCEQSSGSGR
jgi:hypothetical protein